MNIAIVEDEKAAADALKGALEKYGQEVGKAISITIFNYAESFLNNYKPVYDLVFMDIMLCGMDGMAAAHKLREFDAYVPLIFITSMAQFALEGYSVNAMDYIVKPFKYFDLKMRLDRVCRRISEKEKYIDISIGGGRKRLNIADIIYVETSAHQLIYHLAGEVFTSYSKTMKELEAELAPFGFARCSIFCLVNMNLITRVQGNEVEIGKEVLPITRGKKKEFLQAFNSFVEKK